MRVSVKQFVLIALAACIPFCASAKEATINEADYSVNIYYNDNAAPGDAVFVRMKFSQQGKKNKVSKEEFAATTARLELILDQKVIRAADFYVIDSSKTTHTLLAGIPLSSWWTSETKFKLVAKYNLYGKTQLEVELPFSLVDKTFISETIELDARNTAIKTDTSTERMTQIDRLNDILYTTNKTGVYQTAAFTPPTTATRRTSYFADRRVYQYTNGKSSTSLHYGIDYGIPKGSEVRACAKGKVVLAEMRNSTGWSVVIEHLPGLYSLYYHMDSLSVKEGDIVESGTLIGLSGMTGLATGPHLHWEMRLNGEAVSPDFFTTDFTFATLDK
ncbi:MAG: M23 family metallopeptidase [Treponema sp.]|nr:M23 family metallopeptidase [Treponema sp.]